MPILHRWLCAALRDEVAAMRDIETGGGS